jgi:hypothetical protein
MVVGRFRFTGCPPAFRRCTSTLMVYTGVATKVTSFFHNKKTSYEILYREISIAFLEQLAQELAHPHCMNKNFVVLKVTKTVK